MQDYINEYRETIRNNRSMADNPDSEEQVTRAPMLELLRKVSHDEGLVLIQEAYATLNNKPDGTLKDSKRNPVGHVECKGRAVNFQEEIQKKYNRGYPWFNILFENGDQAILYQADKEVMRADIKSSDVQLQAIIDKWLEFGKPDYDDLARVIDGLKNTLPESLIYLSGEFNERLKSKKDIEVLQEFYSEVGKNSNDVDKDVVNLLLQHLVAHSLIEAVVGHDEFFIDNSLAIKLINLLRDLDIMDLRIKVKKYFNKEFDAIKTVADKYTRYAEKSILLDNVYELFYQATNPGKADRLGVVYTPPEIVDFIIRGVKYVMREHLATDWTDPDVKFVDPASGTGKFTTSLMRSADITLDALIDKYNEGLLTFEIDLLPYYIGICNIMMTMRDLMNDDHIGEFPGAILTDFLEVSTEQGIKDPKLRNDYFTEDVQAKFIGFTEENRERIRKYWDYKVRVVFGNPPYNDGQNNYNELNPNKHTEYSQKRLRDSYLKDSRAQKVRYDQYVKFMRMASDQLSDTESGVLAMVTNRSFIDGYSYDAMRRCLVDEYTHLYIVDLGGDLRNKTQKGNPGNVFGIQAGVCVFVFVKNPGKINDGYVNYYALDDMLTGDEKLQELSRLQWGHDSDTSQLDFTKIKPDAKHNWLNQTDNDWDDLIPMIDKEVKNGRSQQAIFKLFGGGMKTGRDEWAYDFDENNLRDKLEFFEQIYESCDISRDLDMRIKWTSELKKFRDRAISMDVHDDQFTEVLFRPFVAKFSCYNKILVQRLLQNPQIYPTNNSNENMSILIDDKAQREFTCLMVDKVADFHTVPQTQTCPRYYYYNSENKYDNITNWALNKFREHYQNQDITKDDIFYYVYAVLNSPLYVEKYAVNLKTELPRILLLTDFNAFVDIGMELAGLHLYYQDSERHHKVKVTDDPDIKRSKIKPVLKRVGNDINLDNETWIKGIPEQAWQYRVGNKLVLDWVLDQYKEYKNNNKNLPEQFNTYRFADYKEEVIDLICKLVQVCVSTVIIQERLVQLGLE